MVEKNIGIMTPQEMPPQLVHHPCVEEDQEECGISCRGSAKASQPTPEAGTHRCHENIIITLVKPS